MGDSSDSEEFYDAEEFTPIKGSKYVNHFLNLFTLHLLHLQCIANVLNTS